MPDTRTQTPAPELPGPTLYARAAEVAQALSSPPRLHLIHTLAQAPRGVDGLAQRLGQSAATTSAQLKVLARAGLVEREAKGQRAVYRLKSDRTLALWLGLRDHVLEADGEGRTLLGRADALAPAFDGSLQEVRSLARARKLSLLDLRPVEEWRSGHLPGAANLPYEDLAEAMDKLPRRKRYLVYCTGPVCGKAIRGTQLLRDGGLRASRLAAGVTEWTREGLPLEGAERTRGQV